VVGRNAGKIQPVSQGSGYGQRTSGIGAGYFNLKLE